MVIAADGTFHLSGRGTRLTLLSLRSEEWEAFLKRRAKRFSHEPRGENILLFCHFPGFSEFPSGLGMQKLPRQCHYPLSEMMFLGHENKTTKEKVPLAPSAESTVVSMLGTS